MGGWAGGRERQTDREPDLGRDKRLERERSSKVKHDSHITNTLSNQQSWVIFPLTLVVKVSAELDLRAGFTFPDIKIGILYSMEQQKSGR